MDRLRLDDIARYYNACWLYYGKGSEQRLVRVAADDGELYIISGEDMEAVTPADFCRNSKVVWPLAGLRVIKGGVYYLSYLRDGYKKAPSFRGLHVQTIRNPLEDVSRDAVADRLFCPFWCDDVPNEYMAFFDDSVFYCGKHRDRLERETRTIYSRPDKKPLLDALLKITPGWRVEYESKSGVC